MANAVPKPLNKSNYSYWRDMMTVYLKSQDLWDVVYSEYDLYNVKGAKVRSATDLTSFVRGNPSERKINNAKAPRATDMMSSEQGPPDDWEIKNAKALHAIMYSCEERVFDEIKNITTAKEAWMALGKDFNALQKLGEAPGRDTLSTSTINVSQPGVETTDHNYKNLAYTLSRRRVDEAIGFCKMYPYLLKERLANSRNAPVLHELIMLAGRLNEGKVVEMLKKLETDQFLRRALKMKNSSGDTPLTIAAQVGAINIAELIFRIERSLLFEPNDDCLIPVIVAICSHNFRDMVDFLYSRMLPEEDRSRENGIYGATIITKSLELGKLDIALKLLKKHRHLALARDNNGISPVYAAACAPSLFCTLKKKNSEYSPVPEILEIMESEIRSSQLLVYDAFFEAIRRGNFNFVVMLMKANRHILEELDDMSRNIYMCAIQYRQAEIFNLIFSEKDDEQVKLSVNLCQDNEKNNLLHMAATLPPPTAFDGISGPALHLQRELRWFKEVGNLVLPSALASKNRDGMTPRELFTKNHKDLVVAGEKWMKDTANSCTIIAPLIITIMFAAAFQVPGGNNQDTGFPIFLNKWLFKLYMVSVTTSLFLATTSVLVFLRILTSNYGEEDFFKALPRKMIIGLSTLFLSLASMIIAVCSGLFLTLDGELGILIPIIILAAFPVGYFVRSQFPLLVEIFNSTYRQTIFDRKIRLHYAWE